MSKAPKIPTLRPRVAMAQAPNQVQPLAPASWSDERRGSRHERGYGTAWDRLRLTILKRDSYVCQCIRCADLGLVKPATHVDHIVCKALWRILRGTTEGCDDPSNLQAINADCHALKTVEDTKAVYAAGAGPRG
jgi:5-methylcytosine-specific restriction protein A